LVLGRISRPGLDEGEFIGDVFSMLPQLTYYLLILAASESFREKTKDIKHIICLPPTTDEVQLSRFYNSIDILLHYRKEGETFGMNIAEAMIHGKPVVSHYSSVDNAQAELLLENKDWGQAGIVVPENDKAAYLEAIDTLAKDTTKRLAFGGNGKAKAESLYADHVWARKMERIYLNMTQ